MARTKKGTPPAYPKQPHASGQARITVRLTTGRRRDITLGAFGSPESRAEYQRVLALLEANGGRYPVRDDSSATSGLTVAELARQFWRYAKSHYRLADGSPLPKSWTTSSTPSGPSSTCTATPWPASSAPWR